MFLIKTEKARQELQPGRRTLGQRERALLLMADGRRSVSADSFDGKRSLATTRMFLFDLCERMFVRRDPALAAQFRATLRESRDRESMLSVSEAMLGEIGKLAGSERAASIRERILRLLPAEPALH
jgi:hypothetical protein